MADDYLPAGHSTVSPYLVVQGADRTIAFLKEVLSATELCRIPGEGGRVMHAEVRIGNSVVMLGECQENWPAVPSHVHVYVPDVDAAYQRALAAGATSIQEPVQKGDPDKRCGVQDAGGTTWWLATRFS